jgi:hypothetical protein
MASKQPRGSVPPPSRTASMWAFRIAIGGMILAMIGFVLYDSYASKKAKTEASAGAKSDASVVDGVASAPVVAEDDQPPEIAPPPVEEQPWEAKDDAEVPEGHLSVAEVKPPGPEPTLTAPEAVPPPDPLTHEPPKDNPGGVNGDRPPREIPGMAGSPAEPESR